MLVKCKICGKKIDRDLAYKVAHTTKGGNKQNYYYCSEDEYREREKEKSYYKECQYLIDKIFNQTIVDNTRNKKLSELHKAGYSYEIIYNCINDNSKKIENALVMKRDDFKGKNAMYLKLAYIFGIIKNEISNYEHKEINNNKLNEDTIDKTDMQKVKRRELKPTKCLMDIIKGGSNG